MMHLLIIVDRSIIRIIDIKLSLNLSRVLIVDNTTITLAELLPLTTNLSQQMGLCKGCIPPVP